MPNNNNKKIPEINTSEEEFVGSKPTLKETEARNKAIINATKAGTWEWNIQTGETIINERWAEIIGYSLEELNPITIDTWRSNTHPDDFKCCKDKLKSHFRGDTDFYECECRMKHKEGYWVWVLDRGTVMEWTEDGKPLWMFGTHMDITKLKKTQEELKRQRNILHERSKEISCIFRMSEIVQSKEQTLEEMLQQFVNLIPQAFHHPLLTWAKIAFNKEVYQSKNFRVTPDKISSDILFHGEKAGLLEVFILNEKAGENTNPFLESEIRLISSITERIGRIAERKDSETKLLVSEQKFRTLFETLAQGVVYHNKKGEIVAANTAAERILGLSLEQMQGLTSLDPRWKAIHEDGTPFPGEEHPAMVALRTNQPVYGEIMGVFHPKDEKYHWIKVNAIPQYHQGGDETYQVYASFEDITEQKEQEFTLNEQKEELVASNEEMEALNEEISESEKAAKKANQAKDEFLANMSHELRTPLNGILGFSEILKKTPLNDDQQRYLDIVFSSANHLLEIIRDILDFSRIESGRFELRPEKTNLRVLIEKMSSVFRYIAEKKSLCLSVKIEDDVPQAVEVDSGRLRQILLNLLSNAVKFTEEGNISLNVSRTERLNGKVKLKFKIADTGIGIMPKDQEIIFQPFQQVDMSSTREYEGTGLGLTIVSDLLQKMESALHLNSTFGKGSEFYFELLLPCYEEKPNPLSKKNSENPVEYLAIKNKKILIAEDNQINMEYAQIALSMFIKDLQIIKARDGKEAYNLYLEHKPDLILMDIIMPDLDGYQTTAMIRQQDTKIPIIAMTAKALKEDKQACINSGMDDYITKPVSIAQLIETLKKYL